MAEGENSMQRRFLFWLLENVFHIRENRRCWSFLQQQGQYLSGCRSKLHAAAIAFHLAAGENSMQRRFCF